MKKLLQFCLVASVLAAAGCHSGHSLVGKWTTTNNGQTLTYDFSGDSKLMAIAETKAPVPMTITITGTYTLDKDAVSMKVSDVSMKTTDAKMQSSLDKFMAQGKQQGIDQMNKDGADNKIVWKTDDSVTLTDSKGKVQTLARVKS